MKNLKSGEPAPESGLYEVTHDSHRLMHQVTILKGDILPKCRKCKGAVRFHLLKKVKDTEAFGTSTLTDLLIPYAPAV